MLKNYLRYLLPATIIFLAIFGITIAATLQNWSASTGASVNIDTNACLNLSSSATVNFNGVFSTSTSATTAAITGGTVTVTEPFAGTAYKKVVLGVASFGSSASTTYPYPTAFNFTPGVIYSTMSSGSIGALTTSTTSAVIATSGTVASGTIIIEGN